MKGEGGALKRSNQLGIITVGGVDVYLIHNRGGRGFDAWLLVREGQLLQQVHIGQSILQGHVGRHGNKVSLKQHPGLTEAEREKDVS